MAFEHVEGQRQAQPLLPAGLIERPGDALAGAGRQLAQGRNIQLAQRAEGKAVAILRQYPAHVAIGNHLACIIDQGQLAVRGQAQVAQAGGQVVEGHVDGHHRIAGARALRQADADLPRGEEDIGRGDARRARAVRRGIPGAGTRIEVVAGLLAQLQQCQVGAIETILSLLLAGGGAGDGLHQERAAFGGLEETALLRSAQRAHQQEVAIGIAHVDGRDQRIGDQVCRKGAEAGQPFIQVRGLGDRIEGQLAQRRHGRIDDATRALGHDAASVLCRTFGHVEQDLPRSPPAYQDQYHGQQDHPCHHQSRDAEVNRQARYRGILCRARGAQASEKGH